ncbi:Polysaccharide deacetylase [Enhygromyxa salina]|uniref:Polysaccharide deacetylase n=1 Tax=Enhygromyxa salina TaxID=215803 RepID=A0A2S9YAP6_9BACT|nr:polysaccharide deacetylase family protein [Enhygromyxa salina]PRQ02091.1 Polysaccharide deacetylase [Enhygromyxa salina]
MLARITERGLGLLALGLSFGLGLGCSQAKPRTVAERAATGAEGAEPDEPDATPDPDPASLVAIHLSFDDAPGAGFAPGARPEQAASYNELNVEILATLAAHHAPASVFYNCDKLLEGDTSLAAWAAAGMEIGNHTASHANLAEVGLEPWLDDVRRCDAVLRERLDEPPAYLRYPYLSEGDTPELRDSAKAALADMGYQNAHVTVATTEWLLATAYSVVKQRGDAEAEAEIVAAYRKHMLDAVRAARELAIHEVERETSQIVLFHVNRLAADHLDEVLDDFEAAGYHFVTLDEALADPVFELPDKFAGTSGISWLARIHDPERERPPYWFGIEEGRLTEAYGALLEGD